jgi:hypothetical protein
MSKPIKKRGNPDFCHQTSVPAPTNEEIELRLLGLSYLWVGGANGIRMRIK